MPVSKGPPFRFRSAMQAVAACDYLVQNGVAAKVVGGNNDAALFVGRNGGPYEVLLGTPSDANLASYLLEQWKSEPVELDGELDEQALPDLAVLEASMAPPCPGCEKPLPLDATLTVCPGCQTPVDVASLIVDLHGPEALDACYEPSPSTEELLAMGAPDRVCRACGGPVDERGSCPWCGRRRG